MSSRMFQGVQLQLSEAAQTTIGVIDAEGNVISCSDTTLIGEKWPDAATAVAAMLENPVREEPYTFYALKGWNPAYGYSAFVLGTDAQAEMLVRMTQVSLNSAKAYYEEKHDKGTFVKNIITDNILPGDVYVRAKELHFTTDVPRAVLLVRQVNVTDIAVLELIQNMFPDRQHDFVLSVSESDIVVIKEMTPDETSEDVCALAESIERAVHTELHVQTVIGIGTTANHLRELADRYKEAQVAIEVGKVFENEKPVIHYDNLGIGRIIYQLPTTLCEMFLSEAFKKNPIEALDEDTLDTINRFFENNLNVSETARKLYVHRNTLVYRLEKVKKITGLDLREFEDAILFKVAVMVKQYLDSQNTAKF